MKSLGFALAALFLVVTAAVSSAQENNDDLLTKESLGGLKIGMTEKALDAILGKAAIKKSPSKQEGRDGNEVWDCPAKGLSIEMGGAGDGKGRTVVTFTATKKCLLATAKGIKIGSTLAHVRKAYGKLHENGPGNFLAGNAADSVGIFFTIKDGKVAEMFFGAAS